jgi:Cu2+-exporting ATPase
MRKTYTFTLPEITCAACIEPVKSVLRNKHWLLNKAGTQQITVTALEINVLRKIFTIEIDSTGLDDKAIRNFIIEKLDDVGTTAGEEPHHALKATVGILSGIGFLLLSIFGGGMPLLASAVITGFSTLLTLYVGKEILIEAYQKITQLRTLEMNALFSASAIIALVVSIAALVVPWLPCMLEAGLLTFGFRHLGIAIENRARSRVINSVSFQERTPQQAEVEVASNQYELRAVKDLKPGDIIQVKTNNVIPVNGICLTKDARIEASIINGSFTAKTVILDEPIIAGMKVASLKPMVMGVTATAAESYLAKLDEAILKAESQKSPLEETSQTVLKYFVPALFILSIATAGVAGALFGTAMAIKCLVSLLVSACPCTLGSIVALAVTVSLSKASQEGVLFRSGMALEAAAKTDIVIFDLNGTLTEGNYSVEAMNWLPSVRPAEKLYLMNCLYELQKEADHPIGVTIRNHLMKLGYPKLRTDNEPLSGTSNSGRKLCINGDNYYVGNQDMMAKIGIHVTDYPDLLNTQVSEQQVFFAKVEGGKIALVCAININDSLKKSAKEVVNNLTAMGKEVHICTGADRTTALKYADLLSIPHEKVRAGCKPDENTKVDYIQELKTLNKTVAMIGDAQNDALSLKTCDLGILVKSQASAGMMESDADVIIQSTSLKPILASFEIGTSMVQNIKQNLALSFTYNFGALGLIACFACCAGIVVSPSIGVMLMIAQASLVLLNVYRFKQQPVFYTQAGGELNAEAELNNTTLHRKLGVTQQVAPTPVKINISDNVSKHQNTPPHSTALHTSYATTPSLSSSTLRI